MCTCPTQACVAGSAGAATAFLQTERLLLLSTRQLWFSQPWSHHRRPQECLRLTGERPASARLPPLCWEAHPQAFRVLRAWGQTLAYRWCKAEILTAAVINSVGIVPSCVGCLKVRILCFTELTSKHTLTRHCTVHFCAFASQSKAVGDPWTLSVATVPVSL